MTSQPSSPPDARRGARKAVDMLVEVYYPDRDDPVTCQARDLSPYGVWLETTELLEPGERVLISFRPPRWPTDLDLTITGEVARISMGRRRGDLGSTGMAVEFVDLGQAELDGLEECLKGLPPPLPRRPPT